MTCAAVVGLGRENRFALGAAIGMPDISISARATRCDGTRTATLGRPAVTRSGHLSFLLQDQRQRARPERQREFPRAGRHAGRQLADLADVGDMHDQRIGGRPLLRVEDLLHGREIERMRAKAVHGLGGKDDQLAVAQRLRRFFDGRRIGAFAIDGQNAGRLSR